MWKPSNYVPLVVDITIQEENNQNIKSILVRDSNKKTNFLQDLFHMLYNTNTTNIHNTIDLKSTVNAFAIAIEIL